MPGGGETGVDTLGQLWDKFHENKSAIADHITNGDELGVAYPGTKEGYYRYFAGTEAATSELPAGYTGWELPKGEYIVCSFEAEDFDHLIMNAVYKAHKYLFETWLPNRKLCVKPFAAERYPNHSPDTSSMEIWVLPETEQ